MFLQVFAIFLKMVMMIYPDFASVLSLIKNPHYAN